jgi:hypothetical protein
LERGLIEEKEKEEKEKVRKAAKAIIETPMNLIRQKEVYEVSRRRADMSDDLDEGSIWFDLRAMWAEADKNAKDYRTPEEIELLKHMLDAFAGLRRLGWQEIMYCPKDGSWFLAICAGSTRIDLHRYYGKWPKGMWEASAHGDLWSSRPILWKPMPAEGSEDVATNHQV